MNDEVRLPGAIARTVFPNGLALTLRPDRAVPLVAARCYVRGGSVAEAAPGGRGIAHLLEHLIATAAAAEMERNGDGALLNAFTTHDYTCFHWSALSADAVSSLRAFFAGLERIASLAVDVAAEKEVVLQEIGLFHENRLASFQQSFLEAMFDVHPLRFPVCGYARRLREADDDDLRAYLARSYSGANLRLVLAGDFDVERVTTAVAEACDAIGPGRRFTLDVEEPRRAEDRLFEVETAGVRGAYTQIGVRFDGAFEDSVAFAALAQTVNASHGCALRRDLVETHLARDLAARAVCSAFGAGYFYLLAHHDPGAAIEGALRGWLEEVADGRAALPLDAVRRAAEQDDEPALDGWTARLGEGDVRSDEPLETSHFRDRLRAIGENDVRGAVARSLDAGRLTVGRLHERAARAASTPPRSRDGLREETLPNGVRLLILPTPSGIASCQVLWRGGVLGESEGNNGLSSLTARLLPLSVPSSLRPELRAYQDATDAELFAFSDESFSGISLTAAVSDLEAGLRFLAAAAVEPAFDAAAVERERERTAVWISNPPAAWLTDLHGALKRLLYRRHPYRLPDIGRPESLRALTADDVEACHRQRCVGSNTVVVVSGRVSPASLRAPLARLFSAVPAGAFAPESPEEEGMMEPGLRVEPRAWNIGALAAGYRGVAWEPRLWCALELLRTLLVGPENNSVRGRLVRAMRDAGTAYSVHCYNQAGLKEGYFSIMTAYLPEREAEARAIVAREIDRLAAGEVAPPELARGRKLALLQHLRLYESPRQHACAAGRHLLFAPSAAAPWSGVASALEEITVDEIAAAARKTFRETARGMVLFRTSGE